MLAARDQENLVHGYQAAAASKPLNQGIRQLPPKTPGNKAPKTPFKIPLNDENGVMGNGGGKTVLKVNGKGNENLTIGGKKGVLAGQSALITPSGPRNRAPLGLKTTNAKAKEFQTPVVIPGPNDLGKPTQKSATARKPKPKVTPAKMTKIDVLEDQDLLEEREIEYMPPPAKDLPDLPDDMPHSINLSMFTQGGLNGGFMEHILNSPDASGLTFYQRQAIEDQENHDISLAMDEARLMRVIESADVPCVHEPDCPGGDCILNAENRRKAEENYQKTIAALNKKKVFNDNENKASLSSKEAPTSTISKHNASALSQPKKLFTTTTAVAKAKPVPQKPTISLPSRAKLPTSIIPSSRKKIPTPLPLNPSPMRHTASVATSKTTMGYSKGRTASANLRGTILPSKESGKQHQKEVPDTTLAPAVYIQKYGIPEEGTEMWWRCKRWGCFDEDKEEDDMWTTGRDWLREEAERDFELEITW